MNLERITLKEYQKRRPKSYLEECLANGTAEYYVVNYNGEEHPFFFYKEDTVAKICVEEKSPNSLFEQKEAMYEIFCFLKKNGFKTVKITLLNDSFIERNELAIQYGFKKTRQEEVAGRKLIHYEKEL